MTRPAPPMGTRSAPAKVGVIGTGFIATGLYYSLERRPDRHYQVGLTRRDPGAVPEIDEGRLMSKGFGMDQPIADNKTDAGRQTNRRVEFKIVEVEKKGGPAAAPKEQE